MNYQYQRLLNYDNSQADIPTSTPKMRLECNEESACKLGCTVGNNKAQRFKIRQLSHLPVETE